MGSVQLHTKAQQFINTLNRILVRALGVNSQFTVRSLKNTIVLRIESEKYCNKRQQHLETTLADWERIQAKSTVRTYPQETAEVFRTLGYKIVPPSL